MKLFAAFAISASLLVAQADRTANRSVTAVRYWSLGDVTRVAIEVSGEFQYRTDRLYNPDRVYFDILNARPRIESKRMLGQDLEDKAVKRIRVAETTPGVTRVVLDLAANVQLVTSQLSNPDRLMIELRVPANLAAPPKLDTAAAPAPPATPAGIRPELAERVNAEPNRSELAKPEPAPAPPEAAPKYLPPAGGTPKPEPTIAKAKPGPAKLPPPTPEETAKAARHTASGESSLIRALGLKINRVVIDPGHGGHDQGTTSPHGLFEKELVLDVAQRVGKLIEDSMGAEVIYTRTDDTFVPLEGRTALANDKKADLFLSIHANSSSYPRIAGVETFYLNINGTKDALDVAARENASSQKTVFELQDIIKKITLHDKVEESHEFAGRLQTALFAFSARNFPGSKNRGIKTAPFVVLIGANMPSVLAEIGFLSNLREETLLKKPDYRQKLADALYRGISRYAEGLSHFQMAEN
jgi:N-acetylmuramoyl-L-alanine amidase